LSEQEIQEMLGSRHFDSVLDWETLPKAYHLFSEFMERLIGETSEDADELGNQYIHNPKIVKELAVLYGMKDAEAKSLIQLYRLYIQITEDNPEASTQSNIASMCQNTIGAPDLRKKFEFDPQLATLSPSGLELFTKLIIKKNDEEPIIREVRKGERTLGDYIKILKHGDSNEIDRIQLDGEETGEVWAEIKTRQSNDKGLKKIISRMANDVKELKLTNIKPKDITQADVDIMLELREELDKLLGAIGKK